MTDRRKVFELKCRQYGDPLKICESRELDNIVVLATSLSIRNEDWQSQFGPKLKFW